MTQKSLKQLNSCKDGLVSIFPGINMVISYNEEEVVIDCQGVF